MRISGLILAVGSLAWPVFVAAQSTGTDTALPGCNHVTYGFKGFCRSELAGAPPVYVEYSENDDPHMRERDYLGDATPMGLCAKYACETSAELSYGRYFKDHPFDFGGMQNTVSDALVRRGEKIAFTGRAEDETLVTTGPKPAGKGALAYYQVRIRTTFCPVTEGAPGGHATFLCYIGGTASRLSYVSDAATLRITGIAGAADDKTCRDVERAIIAFIRKFEKEADHGR